LHPEVLVLLDKTITLMESLGFLWVVETGFKLDLWSKLETEKDIDQLLALHPGWDRVLLDHWLEQAYILNLLDKTGYAYKTTKLGKAVENYRQQGLEAMYQELATHWSGCFSRLSDLIINPAHKENLASEMEEELISRASVASELFAWPVLKAKFQEEQWRSVVDIGCGEASYLIKLIESFPDIQAVGVEINPKVALRAQAKADQYGSRLRIVCADALELNQSLGKFDVCLLHNNIYYFSSEQRVRLLHNVKRILNPGGQVGILSALRETDYQSRIFRTHIPQNLMSFFLACHRGFIGLPKQGEIIELLESAGFSSLEVKALALRTSHYFFAKLDTGQK